MSDELKPCPFCGGEVKIIVENPTFQIIGCRSELFMLCPTPTHTIFKRDGEWDYTYWNRRTP